MAWKIRNKRVHIQGRWAIEIYRARGREGGVGGIDQGIFV